MSLILTLVAMSAGASVTGKIDVRFSPNGGCREAIIGCIREADSTIDAAVYTFTSSEVADALDSAVGRGVRVQLVLDPNQALSQYSVAQSEHVFPVRYGGGSGIMHDKFAVIDGRLTITGSYNWTEAAETRNDENLLIISSTQLADTFAERFKFLWTYASPTLNRPTTTPPAATAETTDSLTAPLPEPTPTPQSETAETVYVTKSGTKYHRYGCASLSKSCIPVSRTDAEARGYTPCSRCRP